MSPADRRKKRSRASDEVRGRVRAHDPFELIRWLALSQPDPRKALAELLQNSLDAQALRIRVTRIRTRGVPSLHIIDDGEGVIPEMDRPEALRYIATHIGHSRKRSLSPSERMALMTQGQYGIGLLGFWSLGETLEMRSSVSGQHGYKLVLHRDRPDFVIAPLRGRLPLEETWTEIVVAGLHREAANVLSARRAADYLASELRGQLLARNVEVVIEDKIARGTAPKRVVVKPPRFLGERIESLGVLPVEGHPPARLEIYFTGETSEEGAAPAGIGVYSAGTLVAATFQDLAPLNLNRAPWIDPRLTGLVDFPGLHVAPGSRRGIIADEAAGAFARALEAVEPILESHLERYERDRIEKLDRSLVRDLQRAFRDFYRQRPRYTMLPVEHAKDEPAGPAASSGSPAGTAEDAERASGGRDADDRSGLPEITASTGVELFPAGPLASVKIVPGRILVACGRTRRVRAEALDAGGRLVTGPVSFAWFLSSPIVSLSDASAPEIMLRAASDPGEGVLRVTARSDVAEASAEAAIEVVEDLGAGRSREGIPEPEFMNQPGAPWRSRMQEACWQVNSGHRDFRAVADRPVLKLRYLALLFAKEIVLRSHQDPRLEDPLEQMAEIVSYADLRLSVKGRRGRPPHS